MTPRDGVRRVPNPRRLPRRTHRFALVLSGTAIADAGVKELAPLPHLAALDLRGTKVTDAGLKDLVPLTRLVALELIATEVTDAGAKELQRALPKCQIWTGEHRCMRHLSVFGPPSSE